MDLHTYISTAQMGIMFTLSGAVTAPHPTRRKGDGITAWRFKTILDLVCVNQGR